MSDELYLGRKVWVVELEDGYFFRPGGEPTRLLTEAHQTTQDQANFLATQYSGKAVPCRIAILIEVDARRVLPLERPNAGRETVAKCSEEQCPCEPSEPVAAAPTATTTRKRRQ